MWRPFLGRRNGMNFDNSWNERLHHSRPRWAPLLTPRITLSPLATSAPWPALRPGAAAHAGAREQPPRRPPSRLFASPASDGASPPRGHSASGTALPDGCRGGGLECRSYSSLRAALRGPPAPHRLRTRILIPPWAQAPIVAAPSTFRAASGWQAGRREKPNHPPRFGKHHLVVSGFAWASGTPLREPQGKDPCHASPTPT
mmetsp:Transcript_42773/g.103077  ORF Transcript_42773/g.103077 Transcript_42773/m.103077 type:complete len:201 (-) Transcript_42773:173-775(-)